MRVFVVCCFLLVYLFVCLGVCLFSFVVCLRVACLFVCLIVCLCGSLFVVVCFFLRLACVCWFD